MTLEQLVHAFIRQVSDARRQRDARGTGAMGAGLPGDVLSYVQPSALAELVRIARDMEIALNAREMVQPGVASLDDESLRDPDQEIHDEHNALVSAIDEAGVTRGARLPRLPGCDHEGGT